MNAPVAAAFSLAAEIAQLSTRLGRRVAVDGERALDRKDMLALRPPGVWSPNRSCRLVRAADGWIAVNLARDDDREMAPAWMGCGLAADPWRTIVRVARGRTRRDLLADAHLLGLPVSAVGETSGETEFRQLRFAPPGGGRSGEKLRVVDLSSMWAGPLCGAILAGLDADVVKIESTSRPDAVRTATPALFERLNGAKRHLRLDFTDAQARVQLHGAVAAADVLITSARPRAFNQLGLSPPSVFAANPKLVWVAVTGHGWTGPGAERVAFGDDAAAAGGLLRWNANGAPRFLGDALADPLTGLAAAAAAMRGLLAGGGMLMDVAMARCAAAAAAFLTDRVAA